MARHWFPGTVFGFCSGTLLIIGLTSLRTDHPAIAKQAAWSPAETHDSIQEQNPWLESDEAWSESREDSDDALDAEPAPDPANDELAPAGSHGQRENVGENAIVGETAFPNPTGLELYPTERFFSTLPEFRYRYLFQADDTLGLSSSDPTPAITGEDAVSQAEGTLGSQREDATGDAVGLAGEPLSDDPGYGFHDEYGPTDQHPATLAQSDEASEVPPSAEFRDVCAPEAMLAGPNASQDATDAESEDYDESAEYDAYEESMGYDDLCDDYYEEAQPGELVGRRPLWARRRPVPPATAAAAGDGEMPAGNRAVVFPQPGQFAAVHREEDWEARVAEAWLLTQNNASSSQVMDSRSGLAGESLSVDESVGQEREDRSAGAPSDAVPIDEVSVEIGPSADETDNAADLPPRGEMEAGSNERLGTVLEGKKSGEAPVPSPNEASEEVAPVWDTPMHGEPGEVLPWEDAVQGTAEETVELSPVERDGEETAHDAEATLAPTNETAWDWDRPGYSPSTDGDAADHIYLGDYARYPKYQYYLFEQDKEGYQGSEGRGEALQEADAADSVRVEVVLPAVVRAIDSLPAIWKRSLKEARQTLAQHVARLLNWPRTALRSHSGSVK